MSRIELVNPTSTSPDRKELLDPITQAFGATPNMFRAVANSPAALKGMWQFFGALGHGVIGARLGEQIAVAVADRNGCEYCLAAHTALGRKAGVSPEDMAAAQRGESADAPDRSRPALCAQAGQRAWQRRRIGPAGDAPGGLHR